jgi:hypothetical protein
MRFLYSITTGRSCTLIFLIVWHFPPILSQYSKTFAVISAFAGGSAVTDTSITAVACTATVAGVSAVVDVFSVPGVFAVFGGVAVAGVPMLLKFLVLLSSLRSGILIILASLLLPLSLLLQASLLTLLPVIYHNCCLCCYGPSCRCYDVLASFSAP